MTFQDRADAGRRLAERLRPLQLARQVRAFRGGRPPLPVEGRTAIVVDDGLATGATARAALRAVRARRPAALVLAVPVSAPETPRRLAGEADQVVCVETPAGFRAVGGAYEAFSQVRDQTVVDLLARSRDPV